MKTVSILLLVILVVSASNIAINKCGICKLGCAKSFAEDPASSEKCLQTCQDSKYCKKRKIAAEAESDMPVSRCGLCVFTCGQKFRNDEEAKQLCLKACYVSKLCTFCVTSEEKAILVDSNGVETGKHLAKGEIVPVLSHKYIKGEEYANIGERGWVLKAALSKDCNKTITSSDAPESDDLIEIEDVADMIFGVAANNEATFDCGEAFVKGKSIGNKNCVYIDKKPVVDTTAAVYNMMKAAAAQDGVTLKLHSGFRTMAQQEYLYNCYLTKACNDGSLAAVPGTSNHQNGIALDIDVTSKSNIYPWLRNNASRFGFVRTVASEDWHWELRNTACNAFIKYECQ